MNNTIDISNPFGVLFFLLVWLPLVLATVVGSWSLIGLMGSASGWLDTDKKLKKKLLEKSAHS